MGCSHHVGLVAKPEHVVGIERVRLQPAAVFVEQLRCQCRQHFKRRQEGSLKLDDAVNGHFADTEVEAHDKTPYSSERGITVVPDTIVRPWVALMCWRMRRSARAGSPASMASFTNA